MENIDLKMAVVVVCMFVSVSKSRYLKVYVFLLDEHSYS